jgi:outer membrane protein TolC
MRLSAWLFLCTSAFGQTPLLLEDIVGSVERNYPPLLAAFAERDIANAEVTQAQGRFDLMIGAQTDTDQFGYYPNQRATLGVEQAFSTWGASGYGGWRVGDGSFAPYAGSLETRSAGEWRGGLKVPLLRNREIDERRGNLQKAILGQRLAGLSIDQQRLTIRQAAVRRYWDWVAAGQRLRVGQDILRVALERDAALREASDLGQIPAVEVTENQRQILQRRSQLVELERGVQQAAIDLSLFYRDGRGQPVLPTASQLPPALPSTATLEEDAIQRDMEIALQLRPEIDRLAQQKEQARVDIRMADNERKPLVEFGVGFTAEAGSGAVRRGPNEMKASLKFELPWQRRTATGKFYAASAKYSQLEKREQFARDQVTAEVRDAASAVRTAHERARLLRDEVRVSLDLADAERERFRLGDSTLFTVNLREQAAADSALREVSAVNDYLRALTAYQQATASLLANP